MPPGRGVIEVRVRALDQFFDLLDPAPFYERKHRDDGAEGLPSRTGADVEGRGRGWTVQQQVRAAAAKL